MIGRTYSDDTETSFSDGIIKLFHSLLTFNFNNNRNKIIKEIKETSKSELEYTNRLTRLSNLNKI